MNDRPTEHNVHVNLAKEPMGFFKLSMAVAFGMSFFAFIISPAIALLATLVLSKII